MKIGLESIAVLLASPEFAAAAISSQQIQTLCSEKSVAALDALMCPFCGGRISLTLTADGPGAVSTASSCPCGFLFKVSFKLPPVDSQRTVH